MAPLFDLPAAPPADAVDVPLAEAPLSRADELLKGIAEHRRIITDQQLGEVRDIAEWALEHTVAVSEDASTLTERGLDTGLPLAGEGAPLISDFAVLELGAILSRGVDSVRNYVGQIVELSHRLPQVWARVLDRHVPVTHMHGRTYWILAPGVYYSRGRTGEEWLVTPGGTYALDNQSCPGTTTTDSVDPPDE